MTEVTTLNDVETETSVFGGVHLFSELSQYAKANSINEKVIFTDTVMPSNTRYEKKFRLRFWIDETADLSEGYNNQAFRIKVNVYAKALDPDDILRNIYSEQDDVISYTDSVSTLINPDRGLYRPVTLRINSSTGLFATTLGNSMDWEAKQASGSSMSLLHLRINICELSGNCNASGEDKSFTQEQLDYIYQLVQLM